MEYFMSKSDIRNFLCTFISGQKTHKICFEIRRRLWGEILGTWRGQGNPQG